MGAGYAVFSPTWPNCESLRWSASEIERLREPGEGDDDARDSGER